MEREDYGLSVKVAELSKEDNLQLAQAAQAIVTAFGTLHDKGLIPDEALVDLSYRFAGELVDVEAALGQRGLQHSCRPSRPSNVSPYANDLSRPSAACCRAKTRACQA
jgi:hypothetical protein